MVGGIKGYDCVYVFFVDVGVVFELVVFYDCWVVFMCGILWEGWGVVWELFEVCVFFGGVDGGVYVF